MVFIIPKLIKKEEDILVKLFIDQYN